MKNRKEIKTTAAEIVNYWKAHTPNYMINVPWEDALEYCWRCACKRRLQRCHIIPDSLGGKDEPSNFVLLCEPCHAEGPNVEDPEIMWDWIEAYETPSYDLFWVIRGLREYEFIYNSSVDQDVMDILHCAKADEWSKEQSDKYLYDAVARATIHFGQNYPNSATIAGTYRMMVKSIAKDYGVEFPIMGEPSSQ